MLVVVVLVLVVLVLVVLVLVVLVVVGLVLVVLVVVGLVLVVLVDADAASEIDDGADVNDELDDEEPVVGAAVDRLATSSLGDDAQAQSTTATATTKRPDVTRGRIRSTQLRPGETTRPPREHRTPPGGRSRGPSPA